MTVTIRLAESAWDIALCCRLVNQLTPELTHDYKNAFEKFKATIQRNPDYFLWVAELTDGDRDIVGTAMMHLQHKLSYHCGVAAHLEDVVVDKGYRGKGIGKVLVAKAIATAKEHGCYKIMLTCFEKTIPYYKAQGFQTHDFGMRLNLKTDLYPQ